MEIEPVISHTPLLKAAHGNVYEFLKLLLENGVDVNAQDPFWMDKFTICHIIRI